MTHFSITQTKPKSLKDYIKNINIIFLIMIFFAFSFFIFYSKITTIIFSDSKIDVFQENLNQIAFYFLPIDKNFSKFLINLDTIIQNYNAGENILQQNINEIEFCRDYIKHNKEYMTKLGFSHYNTILQIFSDLRGHKQELFNLLGNNGPVNYLVILQNTNEKRPNGGFFGSFAFISFDKGRLTDLEIIDSYYPDFIAYKTRITAPQRTQSFLPDRKIGYIAGNKFGFTDIDGKNLKDLYEKMFNQTYDIKKVQQTMQPELYNKVLNKYIKGVLFVRSDTLEQIIPGFTQTIQERQFVNASIDLIRGKIEGNKKELYINEVKDFFNKNKIKIVQNIVNNFDTMLSNQFLNIYLSNISTGFQSVISKHNLENVFNNNNIYARDTNVSFNKIDSFVEKTIQIIDSNGKIIIDTDKDIIPIQDLPAGDYILKIFYTLNVPQSYIETIKQFEQKYGITLNDRELWILGVKPGTYNDPQFGKVQKRRETKSTIYFPTHITINGVDGETYYREPFQSDFSNGLFYQMGNTTNHTTKTINIKIKIN